jgi:hypothetical protein
LEAVFGVATVVLFDLSDVGGAVLAPACVGVSVAGKALTPLWVQALVCPVALCTVSASVAG